MDDKIVKLSRKIANLRPASDAGLFAWLDDRRSNASGLPSAIPPFYVAKQYGENYSDTGLYTYGTA